MHWAVSLWGVQGIHSDDVLKTKSFGALPPVEQKVVGQKLERSYDYVQWNCMNTAHGTGWDEHWAMRYADDNVLCLGLCREILGFTESTSGAFHFLENEVDILSGCCYFTSMFSFCSLFFQVFTQVNWCSKSYIQKS